MSWYKIAQKEYNLGTPWPKYPVDEEGIKDYIQQQSKLPSRWTQVDSSFIQEVAYHPRLRILDIRLRSGKSYTFSDVPEKVYKNFMKAQSKGEYFNKFIKNKYS